MENFMRFLSFAAALSISAFVLAQEETAIPAADEWYKTQYAPLYQDKLWDKADELAQHFAETVHTHDDGGESVNGANWISDNLEAWKIDGWIRSELAELEFDLLNATTASFKAKWRDYYTGGNIAYECSWYLADFDGARWLISEYAAINCSDHGL
jgi:hypothetical protein